MRLKPRRVVENILIRLLKDERLVVLLGARQVGKTSIMHLVGYSGDREFKTLPGKETTRYAGSITN